MLLSYSIRFAYLLFSTIAIAFEAIPWTREAFVKYGKTRPPQRAAPTSPHRPTGALRRFAQATVPKSRFLDFYIVGVLTSAPLANAMFAWGKRHIASADTPREPTALSIYMAFEETLLGNARERFVRQPSTYAILALSMYNIHVIARLYETHHRQPATGARIHIGQYLVGIAHYVVTPVAIVADSLYAPGWTVSAAAGWLAAIGVVVFVYASVHQWRCHRILFGLRRGSAQRYAVPAGDLFEWVSSPHYFCEVLVYLALFLATGCRAYTLLWALAWVSVNLGITAHESQKWYRKTFDGYPRDRRAMVPFVW